MTNDIWSNYLDQLGKREEEKSNSLNPLHKFINKRVGPLDSHLKTAESDIAESVRLGLFAEININTPIAYEFLQGMEKTFDSLYDILVEAFPLDEEERDKIASWDEQDEYTKNHWLQLTNEDIDYAILGFINAQTYEEVIQRTNEVLMVRNEYYNEDASLLIFDFYEFIREFLNSSEKIQRFGVRPMEVFLTQIAAINCGVSPEDINNYKEAVSQRFGKLIANIFDNSDSFLGNGDDPEQSDPDSRFLFE